jgi:L-rhamnose isomerase
MRYKDSLDQILSEPYDRKLVKVTVESKVFGIGLESYTAGSSEFTLLYAATHKGVMPLMDNGHYHPTEVVSDKISSLLCYFPEIALHITRPVRWDSDHVVLLDDETKEIAREIVRSGKMNRIHMALDYFDASINRISAWTVGFRSLQEALLNALLMPDKELKSLQDQSRLTELMMMQEQLKLLPFGDVWQEYCTRCGVEGNESWFTKVRDYEKEVLEARK